MNYEINVSLNGKHLFATHPRSIPNKESLARVYTEIKSRFKEEDGFRVMVIRQETVGTPVDVQAEIEKCF
jgi:hypothetical protein